MTSPFPALPPARLLRMAAAAAALGIAAGCGGRGEARDFPSDSAYVEVMAHLALVRQTIDPERVERADSARRSVLEAHDVSAEALRRYAERHGDDPAHMRRVWAAIAERTDSLVRARGGGGPEIRRVPPSDTAER